MTIHQTRSKSDVTEKKTLEWNILQTFPENMISVKHVSPEVAKLEKSRETRTGIVAIPTDQTRFANRLARRGIPPRFFSGPCGGLCAVQPASNPPSGGLTENPRECQIWSRNWK